MSQRSTFIHELGQKLCDELTAHAGIHRAIPSLFCSFLHAEGDWKKVVGLALIGLRVGSLGVCLITSDYFDAPARKAEMRCLLKMEKEERIKFGLFSSVSLENLNHAGIIRNRFLRLTELVVITP